MTLDSFERFAEVARTVPNNGGSRLVPVWHEILLDTDTAVSSYARIRRGSFGFLLESAPAGGETWARYTYMGTEPASAWRLVDGTVSDWDARRGWHSERSPADPLADLDNLISAAQPVDAPELGAFWTGAVGFF